MCNDTHLMHLPETFVWGWLWLSCLCVLGVGSNWGCWEIHCFGLCWLCSNLFSTSGPSLVWLARAKRGFSIFFFCSVCVWSSKFEQTDAEGIVRRLPPISPSHTPTSCCCIHGLNNWTPSIVLTFWVSYNCDWQACVCERDIYTDGQTDRPKDIDRQKWTVGVGVQMCGVLSNDGGLCAWPGLALPGLRVLHRLHLAQRSSIDSAFSCVVVRVALFASMCLYVRLPDSLPPAGLSCAQFV